MKKVLFGFVLLVSLSITATAQQKKPVIIKYYSPELLDEIKATPEQKKEIKAMLDKSNDEIKAIKKNKSLSKEERDAAVKQSIATRSTAYWKALTPAQTKYLRDKKKKLEEQSKESQ